MSEHIPTVKVAVVQAAPVLFDREATVEKTCPPTRQELVDRRVTQHGTLTGYHFLSSNPATVGGAKAMQQEYACVAQPIDQPRRASLPVVVQVIEYIAIGRENAYYISLAAPESDFADARAQMNQIIQTVTVQ